MKLNELIPNLVLDVKNYVLGVYDSEGNLLENPIKSFKLKNAEAFILESNTPEIEDTIFANSTTASQLLYEQLRNTNFYFIVIIKDNMIDEMIIPDEIFYSLDDAVGFAKNELKLINK